MKLENLNYNIICNVDICYLEPIINSISKINNWNDPIYSRSENALVSGKLIEFPFKFSNKNRRLNTCAEEILESASKLVNFVNDTFPSYNIVRGEVATLMPGCKLTPHVDNAEFHKVSRRLHIPIITNDKCLQWWENETTHMEIGTIYELNNRALHSAENLGNTPRTHIIFDLFQLNS